MKTISVTYIDGVFRPSEPVVLPQGTLGSVTVSDQTGTAKVSNRFASVIGAFPADVLDKMEKDIDEAFGQVDADDWK